MNTSPLIRIFFLMVASTTAYAGAATIPEPGVVELLAIAGVAGIVISIRNRRKK